MVRGRRQLSDTAKAKNEKKPINLSKEELRTLLDAEYLIAQSKNPKLIATYYDVLGSPQDIPPKFLALTGVKPSEVKSLIEYVEPSKETGQLIVAEALAEHLATGYKYDGFGSRTRDTETEAKSQGLDYFNALLGFSSLKERGFITKSTPKEALRLALGKVSAENAHEGLFMLRIVEKKEELSQYITPLARQETGDRLARPYLTDINDIGTLRDIMSDETVTLSDHIGAAAAKRLVELKKEVGNDVDCIIETIRQPAILRYASKAEELTDYVALGRLLNKMDVRELKVKNEAALNVVKEHPELQKYIDANKTKITELESA